MYVSGTWSLNLHIVMCTTYETVVVALSLSGAGPNKNVLPF